METSRNLASPATVASLLKTHNIHPRRSAGQNFLIDSNVLEIIARAADLKTTDTAIEVGAGLGVLTRLLLERCGKVFALESDRRLMGVLEEEFAGAGKLVLVEANAARFDFDSLRRGAELEEAKMVANLPYQIAATLVIDCLNRYPWITEYTVMVQKEIAERFTSSPGSRDYSAATVKVRSAATVKRIARVSRNSFYPKPRVDSTILYLERKASAREQVLPDPDFFNRVVTAAFQQRRKKLVNSLSSSPELALDPGGVKEALVEIDRDPACRAEELSPEEFRILAGLLEGGHK